MFSAGFLLQKLVLVLFFFNFIYNYVNLYEMYLLLTRDMFCIVKDTLVYLRFKFFSKISYCVNLIGIN